MALKLLDTAALTAGPVTLNVTKNGQYRAFMIRISATSGAGATPTIADFGTVTIREAGDPKCSLTWNDLNAIAQRDLGQIEHSIGAAGGNPIVSSVWYVASRNGDGNIFDVLASDNYTVEVGLTGITVGSNVTAGGTIKLYGDDAQGAQFYWPEMFAQNMSVSSGSSDVLNVRRENVSGIYVVTPTNVNEITVERDGVTVCSADNAALLAHSNADGRLEAAFTAAYFIDLNPSGAITEALSDNVDLKLAATGGTAAPSIVTVSHDFTPDKYARSSNLTSARADAVVRRKALAGKSRPISVIKAVAGAV